MVGCNNNGTVTNSSFTKTICSICYEDLKPITEDLQSISVCGHVFHELCLQQWFEYCPSGKKRNCPVCKQACTNANVGRLYFQSIGDPNDSTLSQKPLDHEENPKELQIEVNRLEGKVVALASALELQQKEFKEVKDQLLVCKEQLKVEVTLKAEALTQKATIQQLFRVKSEELDKSTLESMRVQDRNMALAKELAALKLASDLNLEEEEVIKLSALGNDAGSKETVDVLRKSLIIRNKSYKELMAKCNILGRGEARCHRKLEKAKEKIKKLKFRVQELETVVEMKENEALRAFKGQDCVNIDLHKMKAPVNDIHLDEMSDIPNNSILRRKIEHTMPTSRKIKIDEIIPESSYDRNDQEKGSFLISDDGDMVHSSSKVHRFSSKSSNPRVTVDDVTKSCHVPRQDATIDSQNEVEMPRPVDKDGLPCSRGLRKDDDQSTKLTSKMDDEVICLGEMNPVQTSLQIRKENRSSVPFSPDVNYFSGGLLGPDGTNWHLGKWCKKFQNQGSTKLSSGLERSNARSGDLIAVGADGRGGRIKVMRTLDQYSSSDNMDTSSWAKKCKHGAKTNRLQPQGCLQIEHFFQKTTYR